MIKHNQYQILVGLKTKRMIVPVTFDTRAKRDAHLLETEWSGAVSLVDIEISYNDKYEIVEINTSVHPLHNNVWLKTTNRLQYT